MIKVAILLNGNARTIETCKENILQTFQFLNPDYYVSTYNNLFGYHPHIQNLLNYREDPIISEEEVISKFDGIDVKGFCVDNINIVKEFYEKELVKLHESMRNLESSFLQYWKLRKGLDLIEKSEKHLGIKYDVVIKTRCDIIHNPVESIDFSRLESTVFVSTGNIFPNDCVVIASRDNMFKIVDKMISEFYEFTNEESLKAPPHGLLQVGIYTNGLNIEQFPIMKHVQRVNRIQEY